MATEKPTTSDKLIMLVYILASLGLWGYCRYTNNTDNYREGVFFYSLLSPLVLYAFSAESGRKLVTFLFWCLVGIGHLIAYLYLKTDPDLYIKDIHVASLLRFILPLVLLFQLLRIASYKIQGKDLDMIQRGGGGNATVVDYVAFFLFVGTTLFLTFI